MQGLEQHGVTSQKVTSGIRCYCLQDLERGRGSQLSLLTHQSNLLSILFSLESKVKRCHWGWREAGFALLTTLTEKCHVVVCRGWRGRGSTSATMLWCATTWWSSGMGTVPCRSARAPPAYSKLWYAIGQVQHSAVTPLASAVSISSRRQVLQETEALEGSHRPTA